MVVPLYWVETFGVLLEADEEEHEIYRKIKKGVVSYPKHLSKEVRALLSKLLNVKEESRIKAEEVLLEPWFEADE